jgi:hypothetical protein
MGLVSNTPTEDRKIDQDDLLVYTLKGSPRKFVREYLQQKLGQGDVWVINDEHSFAVVELTFSGYRITGSHDGLQFSSEKVEALIAGMNIYCENVAA